jgi:hypothetical protein
MEDQDTNGIVAAHPSATQVSAHSVATDLAFARQEIRDLRAERDKLKRHLQLSLGAELDQVTRDQFVSRIEALEREMAALRAEAGELRYRSLAHGTG